MFGGAGTSGSQAGSGSQLLAAGGSSSLAGASNGTSVMSGHFVPEPTGWVLAVIALFPVISALRKMRRR